MRSIFRFFRESYDELRKVVWPSRSIVIRHTIIVVASVAVAMAVLMAVDKGLEIGIKTLINYSK